jgi:hypothetical protein
MQLLVNHLFSLAAAIVFKPLYTKIGFWLKMFENGLFEK